MQRVNGHAFRHGTCRFGQKFAILDMCPAAYAHPIEGAKHDRPAGIQNHDPTGGKRGNDLLGRHHPAITQRGTNRRRHIRLESGHPKLGGGGH